MKVFRVTKAGSIFREAEINKDVSEDIQCAKVDLITDLYEEYRHDIIRANLKTIENCLDKGYIELTEE